MTFKVKFVNGDGMEFEGKVDQLSAQRRTAVGGMIELKSAQEKNPVFVNIDHIVYAANTD